jgi:hypothetical protein
MQQFLLHALAVGDVTRNRRSADDPAQGVANGRDGDVDSDLAAIFSAAHRFVAPNELAALDGWTIS